MMVLFVSQCEKKALHSTRRVLDAFANRIGDSTWQTVITEEGLSMVKTLLRKSATKNTAVACHWIRSRSRSELVWIVGNRTKFSKDGVVPVNTTQRNIQHNEWENDWHYLPQIKALTAMAALLHDWGKASDLFQKKLKSKSKVADPLRHEWVTCALIYSLVVQSGDLTSDAGWLELLHNWSFDERELVKSVPATPDKLLAQLPPIAQIISYIILSHHRLPCLHDQHERNGYADEEWSNFSDPFKRIDEEWGYKNDWDESFNSRVADCFRFRFGLLKSSAVFAKQAKRWSGKLIQEKDSIVALAEKRSLRLTIQYARLCVMLSDHSISSLDAAKEWDGNRDLYANTDQQNSLKQKLDEHVVRVSEQALRIAQSLVRFAEQMEKAYDVKSLTQKSPAAFAWQDKVVEKIKKFRDDNQVSDSRDQGWFVVNMASTGCGKTIANAKIMQALSPDGEGLRYILALGLRTLTLQTGDEYRQRVGLSNDELAVLIGSSAMKELHSQASDKSGLTESEPYEQGSESLESLLEEYLDFEDTATAELLDNFFPQGNQALTSKNKAFLYKPVLVCTIDHVIAATETTRGGRYILPFLRLMSSDLVIDEVDDFDKQDLIAIGRLVHLAGMLGRSVAISSATIPSGLAEGLFHAYQEGWECYRSFYGKDKQPICVWCDEFGAKVDIPQGITPTDRCAGYGAMHDDFVTKRIAKLSKQIVKRKGYIVRCDRDNQSKTEDYFELMKDTAKELHQAHCFKDKKTGKNISFGVVRVANISPCVNLSQYFINADWGQDFAPKIMAYHSRQILLLRHEQERHLDAVLKRKGEEGEEPQALHHPVIRKCIDESEEQNVLFVLVATPVEEVGRDHDFDWAVIEPSSFRSIIQLAGRVMRHRTPGTDIGKPNIAVMQYNLKGLQSDGKPAFCKPGYETGGKYRLLTHDMTELIDEAELSKSINAIPRIAKPRHLRPRERLVDLELAVINEVKDESLQGPAGLQGWLSGYWWTTALPQQFNRFRSTSPEVKLYLLMKDGKTVFHERSDRGEFVERESYYGISHSEKSTAQVERYWLVRDYQQALVRRLDNDIDTDESLVKALRDISEKFGEVNIPDREHQGKQFIYSDQFGLVEKR